MGQRRGEKGGGEDTAELYVRLKKEGLLSFFWFHVKIEKRKGVLVWVLFLFLVWAFPNWARSRI